ncbi:MAG: hypothetical protein P4L83_05505 [Nevskia sp.]|nr:hypothetical protein [Nevskia sp.]
MLALYLRRVLASSLFFFVATAHAQQYTVTSLGTLGGTGIVGNGINDSGQVTGESETAGDGPLHAFLYSNGTMQDLGTLGGSDSQGNGINASGQVTGFSTPPGNAAYHAFLYSSGTMQDLGTLGGTNSYGNGINAGGQVTGDSYTAYGATHAFLYSNGTMLDLNSSAEIGGAASLYTLVSGQAINDNGQILVDGYVNATPYQKKRGVAADSDRGIFQRRVV